MKNRLINICKTLVRRCLEVFIKVQKLATEQSVITKMQPKYIQCTSAIN